MVKNRNNTLPITAKKYKKVAAVGEYTLMVAAYSQDIRYKEKININGNAPYTINSFAYATLA